MQHILVNDGWSKNTRAIPNKLRLPVSYYLFNLNDKYYIILLII